jgi:hypothetical protein
MSLSISPKHDSSLQTKELFDTILRTVPNYSTCSLIRFSLFAAQAMEKNLLDLFPLPPVQNIEPALIHTPPNSAAPSDQIQPSAISPFQVFSAPRLAQSEQSSPISRHISRAQTQSPQPTFFRSPRATRRMPPSSEPPIQRHHPYSSSQRPRPRRIPPTSAPLSEANDPGAIVHGIDTEKLCLTEYRDHSTLTLGILVGLEVVMRDLDRIRDFVNQGFGEGKEEQGKRIVERFVCSRNSVL